VLANDGTGGMMQITHINGVAVAQRVRRLNWATDHSAGQRRPADRATGKPERPDRAGGHELLLHGRGRVGITDTAFVVVTAVPCFARGTMIRTPDGERPVETLVGRRLVETRDHGPQPLRWLGSHGAATGRFAPS
jgi:hypothetical protein